MNKKIIMIIDVEEEKLFTTVNDLYDRMQGYNTRLINMPSKADLDYYKEHFYEKPIPREISIGAINYIIAKIRNDVIDEILGGNDNETI
jgi:hypothetical protein